MLTLSVALSRSIVFALAVASLLFFASTAPGPVDAGVFFVEFSPSNVEILEGESVEVTVTIRKELTSDEVEAGFVEVRLIESDFPSDDVLDTHNVDVPDDEGEGDFLEFTIKFTLKCVDGKVEGASGGEVDLQVDFGSGTDNSDASFSVKCKDGIAVIFDPETLEIFEGEEEEVTVHITKLITEAEKLNGTINMDLIDVDGLLDPDDMLGEADVKHRGETILAKVVVKHTYTLKCINNEIQGAKGEKSGEEEVVLAIEIDVGPLNHGKGAAFCYQREVSYYNTGNMPTDLHVDPETALVYVLNAGGIDVFNSTGEHQSTIAIPCPVEDPEPTPEPTPYEDMSSAFAQPAVVPGCGLQGLGASHVDGVLTTLFVTDFQRDIVRVIPLSGGLDGDVSVGDGPRGVAVDPQTGQAYVANFHGGTVSVIDVATATAVTTIATGGAPNGVAVDVVNSLVYVTDFANDAVIVIDAQSNTITDTIDVGDGPDGLTVDQETGEVWVSNFLGDTISIIDPAGLGGSGAVSVDTVTVGDGANDVAINPLTDRVFVANGFDDTVSIIDRTTHEVVGTVDVGDAPDALGVNPAAGVVYVANYNGDTIALISDPPPEDDVSLPLLLWGDADCNGAVTAVDALKNLQHVAAIEFTQNDPCFPLGETIAVTPVGFGAIPWGDVDCDLDVDAVDALAILRSVAALPGSQQPNCLEIGSEVLVSGT